MVIELQLHCLQSLPLLSKVFLVLSVVDTALVIAFAVWQMTEVGRLHDAMEHDIQQSRLMRGGLSGNERKHAVLRIKQPC